MTEPTQVASLLQASDWIAITAGLVAFSSFGVALWSAIWQRRIGNDRELMNHLVLTLQRAHDAIAPTHWSGPPSSERLAWLTSSRHLLAYWGLKGKISTPLYKTLCDEHEEFWRHQFYILLGRIDGEQFFSNVDVDRMEGENIEPTSAAIMLAFSAWPPGRPDSIDIVSFEQIVREHGLFSGQYRHFREYVRGAFPLLYERVDRGS